MPAFDLRQATPEHTDLIYTLRRDGPREHVESIWGWDEEVQAVRFSERFDPARYQVVLVNGEPVGALSVDWRDDGAYLNEIQIAPAWRNRGYGTAIIRGILTEAGQRGVPVTLQVLQGNPARRLYERLGFAIIAETETHVQMRADPNAAALEQPSIGLWRGAVRLVPHHPDWGAFFDTEAARIASALGERALAIEHVGSTAVPGLLAKPIIDIMVGIADLDDADHEVSALEAIGYERRPQGDLPGRRYMVLGDGDVRSVHLSLSEPASPFWRDHLAFRDRLRADPEAAAAYARLKQELADRFATDRLAYTDGKGAFIAGVLSAPDGRHEAQAAGQ